MSGEIREHTAETGRIDQAHRNEQVLRVRTFSTVKDLNQMWMALPAQAKFAFNSRSLDLFPEAFDQFGIENLYSGRSPTVTCPQNDSGLAEGELGLDAPRADVAAGQFFAEASCARGIHRAAEREVRCV